MLGAVWWWNDKSHDVPIPQHAVTSLEFVCPVSWAPPRSKKVRQTMLPLGTRKKGQKLWDLRKAGDPTPFPN